MKENWNAVKRCVKKGLDGMRKQFHSIGNYQYGYEDEYCKIKLTLKPKAKRLANK